MLTMPAQRMQACLWLIVCAAAGLALLFLFDDSCQQDASLHFLYARWAWEHPVLFVDVWCRPLFAVVYAFPALISYRVARLLTLLISLAVAWETYRLANDLQIQRAPLAVALIWMQPSFFLFAVENMTEPLFALVYVIALRLHHHGWVRMGMLIASLMILARPEGFFLCLLWALWASKALQAKACTLNVWIPALATGVRSTAFRLNAWIPALATGVRSTAFRLNAWIPLLATGALLWWIAAWVVSGDPLFIKHNWPAIWPLTGTVYGAAGLLAYPARLPEVVGLFLLPPFFYGLFHLLRRRELGTLTSSFLLLFILHTIFRAFGMLGSAGYPRYLVTVSPAIALITLVGWNRIADLFSHAARLTRTVSAALIVAISFFVNFAYADGAEMSRDARAINQIRAWFDAHPQQVGPVAKFIWGQPYACIVFDRDPWEQPVFTRNRERDLALLGGQPAGTLVYWDAKLGPAWFGLKAEDFEEAGFVRLHSQSFTLRGYILDRSWFGFGGPREQTMHLFYKQASR